MFAEEILAWSIIPVCSGASGRPLGWGMYMWEVPGWQSSSKWYGVVQLFDGWGPLQEYGDISRKANGLEQTGQALAVVH